MKFDLSTLFWLFFIFAAIQPLTKKRFLLAMRQRLIGARLPAGNSWSVSLRGS